ncbi:type IX secretion system membrane protein PorP/SprF [Marivirga atlantica]|jgi:type IX secretion system PorP/SprF family membrane protein|uniref:Type IX secretion system membrane protein PorP/SprF n=1 Tax=Marivirga atlantica TaxID=1548457 RepID=A0A937DJA0_9BACT|nr:type IX secretion system membrane protein PorP/SprF [Marivirga atlantica]MBL0764674.1 type IX secretion system membrane protein PorP/SprF [Marivirga atlantica]
MRKLLILFILSPLLSYAQLDPLYNQYFFNQAIINPAYTGVHDVFNATAISRTQWAGVEGSPNTNTLSVSTSAFKNKVGIGGQLIYDTYGINNNTEFNLAYSYKIDLSKNRVFSFGLQGGIINYNYNFQELNLEYFDDEVLLNAAQKVTKPNFGMGAWLMGSNYYIGLSIPRVFNVSVNDGDSESVRYRRHFYLSSGYVFDDLFAVKFKPSILLMYVDNNNYALDLNASFLLNEVLWVGASFRNFSAIGLNTQLKVKENFKFGYAFELPLYNSALIGYGTHSLMASIDLELFNRQALGRRMF